MYRNYINYIQGCELHDDTYDRIRYWETGGLPYVFMYGAFRPGAGAIKNPFRRFYNYLEMVRLATRTSQQLRTTTATKYNTMNDSKHRLQTILENCTMTACGPIFINIMC